LQDSKHEVMFKAHKLEENIFCLWKESVGLARDPDSSAQESNIKQIL